jgi:hypothetical protein
MTKPQPQQPQGQPQQQAQQAPPQQGGQGVSEANDSHQSSPQQLEHALAQHAQAHGLSLQGVNWAAVTAAILALLQALSQGQQPQPAP